MRWIDLSDYNIKLLFIDVLGQNGVSRFLSFNGATEEDKAFLIPNGFQEIKNKSGTWIKKTDTLDIDAFKSIYLDARLIEVDEAEILRKVEQARPVTAQSASETTKVQTPVGAVAIQQTLPVEAQNSANPIVEPQPEVNMDAKDDGDNNPGDTQQTQDNAENEQENSDDSQSTVGDRLQGVLDLKSMTSYPKDSQLVWGIGDYMVRQLNDGRNIYFNPRNKYPTMSSSWMDLKWSNQYHLEVIAKNLAELITKYRPSIQDVDAFIAQISPSVSKTDMSILVEQQLIDGAEFKAIKTHNPKLVFDRLKSVADYLEHPGLPNMAAIAMYRVARSLPYSDREKTLAFWGDKFSHVPDTRIPVMKKFKLTREFEVSRVFLLDLTDQADIVQPFEWNGIQARTHGEKILLETLSVRQSDAKTIVALRTEGEEINSNFISSIGTQYMIEGRVVLNEEMTGLPYKIQLMSIGSTRPEMVEVDSQAHKGSMKVEHASSWDDVWKWTSDILVNRDLIRKFYAKQDDRGARQAVYKPLSAGRRTSMVPINLEKPMIVAQKSFLSRRGNIDHYVSSLMGIEPEDIHKILSAEQIDAIGLLSDAFDRGYRGVGNFDQTGIGKGRFCVSMGAIAAAGKVPGHPEIDKAIIFTERDANLPDLVRDLKDTGALARGLKIGILNNESESKLTIRDATTRERESYHFISPEEKKAMLEGNVWPEGVGIILCTYSQFNEAGYVPADDSKGRRKYNQHMVKNPSMGGARSRWLDAVVDKTVMVVRDESHNGGVNSNMGVTLQQALKKAGVIVDSSGSYAPGYDSYNLYKHLFPASVANEDIAKMLRAGGEPLATAMIMSAVGSGNVVRREHDSSNKEMKKLEPNAEQQEYYKRESDRLAAILSELYFITNLTKTRANATNRALIKSYLDADDQLRASVAKAVRNRDEDELRRLFGSLPSIRSKNIGTEAAGLQSRFILALMKDQAVEAAIERLQAGRKPIITVDETGENELRRIMSSKNYDPSKPVEIQFKDQIYRLVKSAISLRYSDTGDGLTRQQAGDIRRNNLEKMVSDIKAELAAKGETLSEKRIAKEARKRLKDRKFFAIFNEEGGAAAYIGAKARRFLVSHPDYRDIAARNDRDAFSLIVRESVKKAADFMVDKGYATYEAIDGKFPVEESCQAINESLVRAMAEDERPISQQVNDAEGILGQHLKLLIETEGSLAGKLIVIEDMIDAMPPLNYMVIDDIKRAIEKAGYSCGEITGRTYEVNQDGIITKREVTNRSEIKDRFNGYADAGPIYDAMISTKAGLVGHSLNSCEVYPDKSPRSLLMMSVPKELTIQIQAPGRIDRMNNITAPEFGLIVTNLNYHNYMISCMDNKMSLWSAGITANRENDMRLEEENMLNVIGDAVATNYLEANPDLAGKLGFFTREDNRGLNEFGGQNNDDEAEFEEDGDDRPHENAEVAAGAEGDNHRQGAMVALAYDLVPDITQYFNGDDIEGIERREAELGVDAMLADQEARAAEEQAQIAAAGMVATDENPPEAVVENKNNLEKDRTKAKRAIRKELKTKKSKFFAMGTSYASAMEKQAAVKMKELIPRLGMLTSDECAKVMESLKAEYIAAKAELDSVGKNPLKIERIEGKVHVAKAVPMSGSYLEPVRVDGDPEGNRFNTDLMLEKIIIEKSSEPFRSRHVEEMIAVASGLKSVTVDEIDMAYQSYGRFYRKDMTLSVDEDLRVNNTKQIANLKKIAENMKRSIELIVPGALINPNVDGERKEAVVRNVSFQGDDGHILNPTFYEVVFVVPGEGEVRRVPLKALLSDVEFSIAPGLNGEDAEEIMKQFDDADNLSNTHHRYVMTGNLWKSLSLSQQMEMGHLIEIEAEDKSVRLGVVLNNGTFLPSVPTPVTNAEALLKLDQHARNNGKAYKYLIVDDPRAAPINSTRNADIKIVYESSDNGDESLVKFSLPRETVRDLMKDNDLFELVDNSVALTPGSFSEYTKMKTSLGYSVDGNHVYEVEIQYKERKLERDLRRLGETDIKIEHLKIEIENLKGEFERFKADESEDKRPYFLSAKAHTSKATLNFSLPKNVAVPFINAILKSGVKLYSDGYLRSDLTQNATEEEVNAYKLRAAMLEADEIAMTANDIEDFADGIRAELTVDLVQNGGDGLDDEAEEEPGLAA